MIPINRTFAPVQALVDELARCGMRHAVTSPGSRNAPIALTLAGNERIDAVSAIDERAAGFMALGMAKAGGRPVAVTCTSGTAAANLLPAVVEAREARVPLIVLTADRPPELRDVGAGQAIDQIKLFGSAAKWFVEVGNGDPGREWATHLRALACRAWWTAGGGLPGPVHLNLPLREPLAPVVEELDANDWRGREDGRPWVEVREGAVVPDADAVRAVATRIVDARRGAIVCGGVAGAPPSSRVNGSTAEVVARLAAEVGWPVLAEPTSGLRCGDHDRSHVVAHYDVLLRDEGFADGQRADLVLRIGDMPTSKSLRAWVGRAEQVVIDPQAVWNEPTRTAETILAANPTLTCDALAAAIGGRGTGADSGWVGRWRAADAVVGSAFAAASDEFEAKAYAGIEGALPEDALIWVSSSMPIRYVESYFPSSSKPLRFLSNRGANGIDGVVASAAGAALATRRSTFVLIGEIALLHDVGGLLAARRAGVDLTIVCVNNGGGGIFDFLPVSEHADAAAYERHVATPAGIDLAALATLAGMQHRLAVTAAELSSAIAAGPGLIEVSADRARSVALSRALTAQVAERLSSR
ncbi:MAG TPA: 2-succinyl-5-enolpyruvyl-6-hydroxy-3-cyclohexene-1-carboxylic-acid synthase [Thermoleophilaceae bacterium]|nr:2-succinyl-5-enolpyruvyl-6-hydroxy-3-cyclohexene-1-carboxylic-acid synthase [Thermoleophilaceae bacterium]